MNLAEDNALPNGEQLVQPDEHVELLLLRFDTRNDGNSEEVDVRLAAEFESVASFFVGVGLRCICGVTFAPQEFTSLEKGVLWMGFEHLGARISLRVLTRVLDFPPHHAVPLVQLESEAAAALGPFGVI